MLLHLQRVILALFDTVPIGVLPVPPDCVTVAVDCFCINIKRDLHLIVSMWTIVNHKLPFTIAWNQSRMLCHLFVRWTLGTNTLLTTVVPPSVLKPCSTVTANG